jgi:hypothetical protein
MSEQKLELLIDSDATAEAIYDDALEHVAKEVGSGLDKVCRVSHIDWEKRDDSYSGWVVRSVKDPQYCLRYTMSPDDKRTGIYPSTVGNVAYFESRQAAIEAEIYHFWTFQQLVKGT